MNDQVKLLDVVGQLHQEVQRLEWAQTVQRSAYLLLARHLAKAAVIHPHDLEADLRLMVEVQPDEGWKDGHLQLADELRLACGGQ